MAKIRDLFHKIGNLHNVVSIAAGVSKAELKEKFNDVPAPADISKIIHRLSELEKTAVQASEELRLLKDIVYKIIDPDTGNPL